MPPAENDALVILEFGAEWPGRYAGGDPDAPQSKVISQREDEPLSEFVDRVGEFISNQDAQGALPGRVIVACSDRSDDGAITARRALGRRILSTFAHLGRGSLLFAESQRKSGGSRQALSDLATDLEHEFEEDPVQVSVRFGQPSRPPTEPVIP
jgi:hypothetical protein